VAGGERRAGQEYTFTVLGEVLTATVTPFDSDGAVDYDRYRELCGYLVDNGSDGVVVSGTTGESPTLSDGERLELLRAAIDAIGDRATVIAGTGTYSTAHSIHLTEQAHEAGAHGFLVVAPYYNKPPPRGIVAHFKAVAAASDRPVMVYNIPGRVVINIEPKTMAELAEIPNVTAVKQANDDLDQAQRIVELGLDLYAGDDNLVHPFLELGGKGGVCVHTHVVGPQVKEMVQRFRDGDLDGAKRIHDELAPAYELLAVTTGPIQIKAALNLLGHDVGGLRLPLVEASGGERTQIRDCLERLGVLEPARA
jgi:4-hydroxy-tetrahydrodipicolinate synthase